MIIIIGLFNTGGYGIGYGNSKKAAIDHILSRIEREKSLCHIIKFVVYPYSVRNRGDLCELQLYAFALTGNKLAQSFCTFLGK